MVRLLKPYPALREFVSKIMVVHYQLDKNSPPPTNPFPPQSEQCLYFYPYDRILSYNHLSGTSQQAPKTMLVGPQLSRVDLTMGYNMLVIQIAFQPGGMHRLLNISMTEMIDRPFDATLLIGNETEAISDKVAEAGDYQTMTDIVQTWLRAILNEAITTKRQLMMHLTQDSSLALVLRLMRQTGSAEQWRARRVRIEHNVVGHPTKEQRAMLRDYGVLMMHTPKYNPDGYLRSFLNENIIVGIAPDGCQSPFRDLAILTGGMTKTTENLTMEQAVIAYTKTSAYAEFKEKEKGMLIKGMLADLAVLSQDIFTIANDKVPDTKSLLTMIDGKIVHRSLEMR